MKETDFELKLTSGSLRARRLGSSEAPLVLLVHGLSANMRAFDTIVERLAASDRQVVALDLRGRGRSEITPAGSYGLESHSRDILEAATQLGAERFDLIGWSMGAAISVCVANHAPERLRRVVLIDPSGKVDRGARETVTKGLARLDMIVEQPSAYLLAVRQGGAISRWSSFWTRFYEYELGPYGEGFKATTSKLACLEDLMDIGKHDWPLLWKGITTPTLLVRCLVPIAGGFVVSEAVRDELRHAIRQIKIVEVAADHYTVMNDESASKAIHQFLDDTEIDAP